MALSESELIRAIKEKERNNRGYLARFDNYPLTRKNSRFDLHILQGHLWGGRFQMAVIGER